MQRLRLKTVLLFDAAISGANGVAYLALANVLDSPLGVEAGAQRAIGAFLVLFALGVLAVASQRPIRGWAAELVIGANALWVLASATAIATEWADAAGDVWIAMQALVVGAFAALQWAALARESAPREARAAAG